MSDIKPLPCPWCGRVPSLPDSIYREYDHSKWVAIKCKGCDNVGPEVRYPTGKTQWDWMADLIAEWNKRPVDPIRSRSIDILRRIVNGYRPAHGSMEAWDDALALLREVDGGVIADTR